MALSGVGEIIQDLELQHQYAILKYYPLVHISLLSIGYYYFVVFLLQPTYRFSKKDFWFLLPFCVLFFIKIILFSTFLITPDIVENNFTKIRPYFILTNFIPIFYLFFVVLQVLKKVNYYHQQLFDNYSEIAGKNLFWLRNLTYFFLALGIYWFLVMAWIFTINERVWPFYYLWVSTCLIMIWLAYFVILRRDVFAIPVFSTAKTTEEKNTLSDKTEEHYQRLLQLLQEEKLYRDAQLSMDTLAKKTNLSNGYLSKIINHKEGKNFYDFVNAFRVTEVKAHLNNADYAHYSILGIGLEAGFKSKSTFNAVFKKMTGMTPSQFKKELDS